MQLNVEIVGIDSHFPDAPSISRTVTAAIYFASKHLLADIDGRWSVVLTFLDADEISGLHGTYFDDPTPTDVITFPSGELEAGGGSGHLGDIAVCVDVAARQARDLGQPVLRELAFLSLHGLLHLVGYSDRTTGDRDRMIALQEQLLADFEQEYGALRS